MNEAPVIDAQITSPAPVAAPAPVEAPVVQPTPAPAPAPAPVSDRTSEQFSKLLENNKRLFDANESLKQELANRAAANQQFAPINQPPVPQQQVQQQVVNPQDYINVDPVSGERYVDEGRLQAKIADLERKSTQAQEAISRYIQTSEQREIEKQNQEAYAVYPELNPNDYEKHDQTFHNQTRAIIYDSLINPKDYNGRPLTFKEAADFVAKNNSKGKWGQTPAAVQQPAPIQAPQEAPGANQDMLNQAQEIKNQASASAQGQYQPERAPVQSDDYNRLVDKTRHGDLDSLARRLAMTDHTFKDQMSNS